MLARITGNSVEAASTDIIGVRISDLAVRLAEIEDSPWAEWGKNNKAITKNQLALQLKPLSVFPRAMRLPSGDLLKGYDRLSFEDAWERYLGGISLEQPV